MLAYAKNNSCRGHMAKREQSLWHSETLLCQGKTGSREVKNAAFTKFLWVSFTHPGPAGVLHSRYATYALAPILEVPITYSIMGPFKLPGVSMSRFKRNI